MSFVHYLIVSAISVSPLFESRLGIVYGFGVGLNPYATFLTAVALNILSVFIFIVLLKKSGFSNFMHRFMSKHISNTITKHKDKFSVYKELGLFLFVTIPWPGTGAYGAAMVADVLKFSKRKTFYFISLGVIASGLLIFFGLTGIKKILNSI